MVGMYKRVLIAVLLSSAVVSPTVCAAEKPAHTEKKHIDKEECAFTMYIFGKDGFDIDTRNTSKLTISSVKHRCVIETVSVDGKTKTPVYSFSDQGLSPQTSKK